MPELDRYYLPAEKTDYLTAEAARTLIETELRSYSSQFGIGGGNYIFKATNEGIQLGHALFSSAPFRVTMSGALTATSATITGSITATTGAIGGFDIGADYIRDAANSFGLASTVTGGDDVRFWAGAAFASRATAPLRITEAGAITATSATITGAITTSSGSSIDGQYLTTASVVSSKVNASIQSWNVTSAFTVTDSDTVAWASGSLILSDGTTYSITGSNTGNMAARTYIYFDAAVSTTAFQTTTTASTAVGDGKILVATAVNNTNEATFEVFGGVGGLNVDGSSIVALSITGSEIAANTISANKLTVSQLSAITADLGSITAGTIVMPSGGFIRSGQTAYDTGTGFYIGNDVGTPRLSLGNSAGNKLTWDGSTLAITGSITTTSATIGGFTVGATTITATNLTLDSAGQRISLGSSNDIVILDADDATYRLWIGNATAASAPFSVSKAGALVASSATITGALTAAAGSVISGTYLTDNTVTSAKVNVAARGWTQTSVFSVTDSDTVAWGAGTFTASDGTAYSIGASNTGNMAAKTYIYLDIGVSTTAYQTTTTAASAVGDGKVLIAVAQNNTNEAIFQVFGGNGGQNIDASSIVTGSITANEIAASTITAGKLSVSTLSAITADLGTITAGAIGAGTATIGAFAIGATSISSTGLALTSGSSASLAFGSTVPTGPSTGTGIYMDKTGLFGLSSNTQNFKIDATNGNITAIAGTIAAFTLASSTLSATNLVLTSGAANTANIAVGTGANTGGLNSGNGSSDILIWAGSTHGNRATAPFRVDGAGNLTATSATISSFRKSTSTVTITNTTTETTLMTEAIAGGVLGTTGIVEGKLYIDTLGVTLTSTIITLRFKYGATTLTSIDYRLTSGSGSTGLWVDFVIHANAATNAQVGNIRYTAGPGPFDATYAARTGYGTAAIDSTSSQNLVITAQYSAASGGSDTLTMRHYQLDVK